MEGLGVARNLATSSGGLRAMARQTHRTELTDAPLGRTLTQYRERYIDAVYRWFLNKWSIPLEAILERAPLVRKACDEAREQHIRRMQQEKDEAHAKHLQEEEERRANMDEEAARRARNNKKRQERANGSKSAAEVPWTRQWQATEIGCTQMLRSLQ